MQQIVENYFNLENLQIVERLFRRKFQHKIMDFSLICLSFQKSRNVRSVWGAL